MKSRDQAQNNCYCPLFHLGSTGYVKSIFQFHLIQLGEETLDEMVYISAFIECCNYHVVYGRGRSSSDRSIPQPPRTNIVFPFISINLVL